MIARLALLYRESRYNGSGPRGAGNTGSGLTRSLDHSKEGLMPHSTCSVAVCDRPVKAKKLCQSHYARLLRTGDPGVTALADPTPRTQEAQHQNDLFGGAA